jgi:hypothetical protein
MAEVPETQEADFRPGMRAFLKYAEVRQFIERTRIIPFGARSPASGVDGTAPGDFTFT